MKRLILLPPIMQRPYVLVSQHAFFKQLAEDCGFDIIYTKIPPEETHSSDIVLIWISSGTQSMFKKSLNIEKKVKIIYLLHGDHTYGREHIEQLVNRGDLIIHTYGERLRREFVGLSKKLVFIPQCYGPRDVFELPWNEKPIMRCLFTGHTNGKIYPFRSYLYRRLAREKKVQNMITKMRHPRWESNLNLRPWEIERAFLKGYAKALNSHFCAVATASRYHQGVAKYFEIPATGALLLGEDVEDIRMAGLEPNKHFVPIEAVNVIERISDCLNNPKKYNDMRRRTMEYVRTNHSLNNRVKLFREILGRLA